MKQWEQIWTLSLILTYNVRMYKCSKPRVLQWMTTISLHHLFYIWILSDLYIWCDRITNDVRYSVFQLLNSNLHDDKSISIFIQKSSKKWILSFDTQNPVQQIDNTLYFCCCWRCYHFIVAFSFSVQSQSPQ